MFDHIGFNVADFQKSKRFYLTALAPLGHRLLAEGDRWAMIGDESGRIWIASQGPASSPFHLALAAKTRAQVRAFYSAAIGAGGRDNGVPGIRANYAPSYYAAFVLDPDGHNVEAVCYQASE
ncbi:MAG TPA: VOC family protein [Hyphomicrobiales bacterium]|nr:VOC family protein [Hyphomicrobiales bacterium]